ncbi:MAG: flagellar basal body protein [Pirellulaceae bacterium]|jgi:flagellar basal-body rod protein FlgC|nr:flagellar basal body protein [Pirellulaceae bacterium]
MLSAMDISTSALVANRARLDAISGNIANLNTVQLVDGQPQPYAPKFVVFAENTDDATASGATGVEVAEIKELDATPNYKYEPNNPLAFKSGPHQGFVPYPGISLNEEFTNALLATRAYEANIGVMEISKNLGQQSLRIIA